MQNPGRQDGKEEKTRANTPLQLIIRFSSSRRPADFCITRTRRMVRVRWVGWHLPTIMKPACSDSHRSCNHKTAFSNKIIPWCRPSAEITHAFWRKRYPVVWDFGKLGVHINLGRVASFGWAFFFAEGSKPTYRASDLSRRPLQSLQWEFSWTSSPAILLSFMTRLEELGAKFAFITISIHLQDRVKLLFCQRSVKTHGFRRQ